MKFGELGNSRFLKQEDVGEGITLTVNRASDENLAQEGARPEMAGCLGFADHDKMFVVKPVNGMIIQQQLGLGADDDLSACVGCKLTLYVDHSIVFGGKMVGGIRVKTIARGASRTTAPPAGSNGDATLAAARQKAWEEFKAPFAGQPTEEIAPAWRQLLATAVPGKSANQFTLQDWNKVRTTMNEPASTLSDAPEFDPAGIPF